MDEHLRFVGTWRDGWVMYDGTIVVLYAKPGLHGDAYYTHKANFWPQCVGKHWGWAILPNAEYCGIYRTQPHVPKNMTLPRLSVI